MANISTFDCLSNELIICIFDYLKPAENFQSFFDCNDRLQKLVKRYVTYSRRALDKDIERFSTLHSWYKHLHFVDGGVTFYMVPLKGEQERYNFSPSISDPIGIHWHFWRENPLPLADKRIAQISEKYPIKLNPLFHPQRSLTNLIVGNGPDFIRQYHPLQFEGLKATLFHRSFTNIFEAREFYTPDVEALLKSVCENEQKRLRNIIQETADCIWKEIQALEDVNILEIKYAQQSAGFVMCVTLNDLFKRQPK